MKKIKLLSTIFTLSLLISCTPLSPESIPSTTPSIDNSVESLDPTQDPTSIEPSIPTLEPTSENVSVEPPSVTTENSTTLPDTSISNPTQKPTTQPSTTPTSNPTSTPTTSQVNDEIPASGQTLPIGDGNKTVTGPTNSKNPIDIAEWQNFDFFNSKPEYWSYIQGNNKVNNGSYYAESAGGGYKFSQLYYGLQTPVLTQWVKTEVRLTISKVANNSQKKDVDEPIFHIYGYDLSGKMIHTQYLEQGSITAQSEGKEVKFYIKNENVSYFELRLNAFPYKGSQCYNFGVSQISIKGWQYE